MKTERHAVAARFESADALVAALRDLHQRGFDAVQAFAPHPLEEAHALLSPRRSPIPGIMLAAGIIGAVGALGLQVWAAFDYPENIAGRPLFSWPAFVPVAFELTILSASFTGAAALLRLTRLPRLDHPMFDRDDFVRASQDAYFVCVETRGQKNTNLAQLRALLENAGGREIREVCA